MGFTSIEAGCFRTKTPDWKIMCVMAVGKRYPRLATRLLDFVTSDLVAPGNGHYGVQALTAYYTLVWCYTRDNWE